jgi:hypothetical protein
MMVSSSTIDVRTTRLYILSDCLLKHRVMAQYIPNLEPNYFISIF